MQKKKKIILIVILIVALIFITAISVNGILNMPKTDEESLEKSSLEDSQEALERKKQFEENNSNIASVENYVEEDFSEEELQQIEAHKQEVATMEQKIKDIMNRYYPDEFNKALQDLENDNKGITSIKNTEIPNSEKEVFNLVLKVLEEEELSNEDSSVLKDFLRQTRGETSKDESLNEKVENILSE